MLTVGETSIEAVVSKPGFHVYEEAPLADRVADWPTQILVDIGEIIMVGLFTTS